MEQKVYEYESLKMETTLLRQILIVGCINFGQIIVGYSVGWSAPIIPKLQNVTTSPLETSISDTEASWIGSLLYVGAIVGPYATGYLSNLIGRKPCLLIGGLLNTISYLLVITTRNIVMVFALRVIGGLGMGITTVCNLVYVGEIASTHIRGILLTSTSIVGITGTLIVYAVVPYVSYTTTGYIALAISALHMVAVFFYAPESPVYHAMKEPSPDNEKYNEKELAKLVQPLTHDAVTKGNDTKAAKTLNMLGRGDEVDRVVDTKSKEKSNVQDWLEIFTIKSNRMSLLVTFTLGALQQMSGVAVVLFFATNIFDIAGSSIRSDVATIIIGVTRLISSIIAPTFIERAGRKFLLLISTAACAFSLLVLGSYFFLDRINSSAVDALGWLPLLALIIYFFSYEAGFGTIPSAIVGEMFRTNVRANGSALAITMSWLIGFGLTTGFNSMVETFGGDVTFWLFAVSCVIAFLFTLFVVPETKGKSLNEIQDMMS